MEDVNTGSLFFIANVCLKLALLNNKILEWIVITRFLYANENH